MVGHNGINRALLTVLHQRTAEELETISHPKNASVYVFQLYEDGKHELLVGNCVKHTELKTESSKPKS